MQDDSIPKITRRDFLKGSAALGASVALMGKLHFPSALEKAHAPSMMDIAEVKRGACRSCLYGQCTVLYKVKDGVLTGVEGDPEGPWNTGKMCVRGNSVTRYVYNPYRIKNPMKRTNPKKGLDVDPGWVEITWDEAINTLVGKLSTVRKEDPRKLVWYSGFPSIPFFVGGLAGIFAGVFGTPNAIESTGAMCSVHMSSALVSGSGIESPDIEHGKYILAMGWTVGPNIGSADGGSDKVLDAVERGLRIVAVDPHQTIESRYGEWVPIRPGADLPFLLAMAHVILYEIKKFDEDFLKSHTTATYLIDPKGNYIRDPESQKPLMYNSKQKAAVPFDDPDTANLALEGEYEVNGIKARPVFALIKQGMNEYTPEWQENLTTVPAATLRRISQEFVEAAHIGDTIMLDGVSLPYRPASIGIGRGVSMHRDGHLAYWMSMVINQLVGAVSVPGGIQSYPGPMKLVPDQDGVVTEEKSMLFHRHPFKFPPDRIDGYEYMPYGFSHGQRAVDVILEPEKYHMNYKPEILVQYASNWFTKAGADVDRISDALRQIPFIFSFSYHFDEHTAFADIVVPDCTYLEQNFMWNGEEIDRPGHRSLWNHQAVHKPIVTPLYQSRPPDEVLIDVAERVGMLYGPGQLNFIMNFRLGLKPEYQLALDQKYTTADMIDRALRSYYGDEYTFDAVAEKGGAYIQLPASQSYSYTFFPGNKTRLPIYNMSIKTAGEELLAALKTAGIQHPGWSEDDIRFYYVGVPAWKPTPTQEAPDGFDLYGVVWKNHQFLFDVANTNGNPYLQEVLDKQHPFYGKVLLHPKTADKKGLSDGDQVYLESQFGGKVGPYPIKTTGTIHPEAVGVISGVGDRKASGMNPYAKRGIAYNRLLSYKWESLDIYTGGIELSPRIKVTKA